MAGSCQGYRVCYSVFTVEDDSALYLESEQDGLSRDIYLCGNKSQRMIEHKKLLEAIDQWGLTQHHHYGFRTGLSLRLSIEQIMARSMIRLEISRSSGERIRLQWYCWVLTSSAKKPQVHRRLPPHW